MSNENNKIGICRACNGAVSKTAKTCPHCGQRKPYKAPFHTKAVLIYSLAGFSLWFILNSLSSLSSLSGPAIAPPSIPNSEETTIETCESAIRATANNPSTIKIHRFTGYASNIDSQGTRRIVQTFSAKNGFGLEKTYDAYCSMTDQGEFDIKIVEQGG